MDRLTDTNLSALFGIEMDIGDDAPVPDILCAKCGGGGKFLGRNGKPFGPCFACDGSGLQRHIAVELQPGDCVKCLGSGEWRRGRACFACNGTGREVETAEITVDAIVTAFEAARANGIKRPKLRLATFVFSRAPDHGNNAGAIYVKQSGEYLGKVSEGRFRPSFACDSATTASVIKVASDPHKAAVAYGQKTGSCGCCGRELTNKESIDLGIGPICRDKFGW
jgi:hypothetical protein